MSFEFSARKVFDAFSAAMTLSSSLGGLAELFCILDALVS
jgi:hypothetical protein